MSVATRLPARIRKLELQTAPRIDEITFTDRLITFRIILFALHDHDRGVPDYMTDPHMFEHVLTTLNASEAEIRRLVHDALPEFEMHVHMPADWSPLHGMAVEAAS